MSPSSSDSAHPIVAVLGRVFGRRAHERLVAVEADLRALAGAFGGRVPPALIRTGVRPSRFPQVVAGGVPPRTFVATEVATESFEIRVIPGGEDAAREASDVAVGVVTVVDGAQRHVFSRAQGQSILEAAEAHGLDLVYSCRAGGCAACRMRLVSGRVALPESHCLNAGELAAGHVLACVGCNDGDVTLEVE